MQVAVVITFRGSAAPFVAPFADAPFRLDGEDLYLDAIDAEPVGMVFVQEPGELTVAFDQRSLSVARCILMLVAIAMKRGATRVHCAPSGREYSAAEWLAFTHTVVFERRSDALLEAFENRERVKRPPLALT